ncbi:hypothetical protein EVAR_8630_1 [Eumeta japonica]|uniref:Uncharacterized protein n=1 Tax=Eumeta variegata TaxID=151549 RepID=A0A4C1TUD5_EUMVA|nr:hypothetical protein EVAR_8630_1 [Eumeta japonica]
MNKGADAAEIGTRRKGGIDCQDRERNSNRHRGQIEREIKISMMKELFPRDLGRIGDVIGSGIRNEIRAGTRIVNGTKIRRKIGTVIGMDID